MRTSRMVGSARGVEKDDTRSKATFCLHHPTALISEVIVGAGRSLRSLEAPARGQGGEVAFLFVPPSYFSVNLGGRIDPR
jgi:hypothetical protein